MPAPLPTTLSEWSIPHFPAVLRMKFESTFTNLPNHLNYAPPSVDVSSPSTFGKITSGQTAENAGNRTGQLALRIEF
jgi:hypothetical protein